MWAIIISLLSSLMHQQEDVTPTPQKYKSSLEDLEHPKHSTIPRYSDKFKDIIAKSATLKKYQFDPHTPVKQESELELPQAVSKADFFFFRVKSIGVGAHSFVYLVQDESSKILLAQKSVTKEHAREIEQDLVREIKLLFYLQHQNIVKLYQVYPSETHLNMVMEYGEDSLFSLKQKFGIFKEKEIIEVTRQLLQALQYLHSHQIVHADVKLENIMISNGTIKLCDFGLAHRTGKDSQKDKQVVGTLEYLPPEYAQGVDSGPARDIWAVGILVFEMAIGKHPFEGLKENEKWAKLVNNPPTEYLKELEEAEKGLAKHTQKVKELVRGIFVGWEKRWSARHLLELHFFNVN